jgi:hypothetical protein
MIPILNNKKFFFKLDGEQQVLDNVFINNNFNALDDNRRRTLCWADLRDGTGTGNLTLILTAMEFKEPHFEKRK